MTAAERPAIVARLRERIYQECDAAAILSCGDEEAARSIRQLAHAFLREERCVLTAAGTDSVIEQVVAATLGLGPLEPLLADPRVSEVMVNGPHAVYVEREGTVQAVDAAFADDEHVLQVIDRILAPIGRRIDALSPMVDARLPDGSRVNAVIPPLSVEGPVVTIRRFLQRARTLDDLVRLGTCSTDTAALLRELVEERANVIVAGPTSSGKTTLMAAALACCPPTDRIVVIEDAAELPIEHPHRVRLESRPSTWEARGEVRVRDLVRNALRMRPDRIILGEVRGPEAFDLLQALNTGHRGCWSTVHANTAEDALLRIEAMALMAGVGMPQPVLRDQVARAIDAVAFVERDRDGARRLSDLVRVEHTGSPGGWSVSPWT